MRTTRICSPSAVAAVGTLPACPGCGARWRVVEPSRLCIEREHAGTCPHLFSNLPESPAGRRFRRLLRRMIPCDSRGREYPTRGGGAAR